MPPNNYRRRRRPSGPNKNELRAARHEKDDLALARAGTLRQRFPAVTRLELEWRLEGPAGNILGQETRAIGLEEALDLQIDCPSVCGNGQFNLLDALESAIGAAKESDEGFRICQAVSYMDGRSPCGTKLHYRLSLAYQAS